MNSKMIEVNIDKLKLDLQNPRLPYSSQSKGLDEKKIINWMLEDASIIELMLAIGQNDFFVGESLLVIEDETDKGSYIVIEGNRRLTSIKLLKNPELATVHTKKIQKVLEETDKRPNLIPCILFDKRSDISQYLGYRHVTGVKPWGMLEKARYMNSLVPTLESKSFQNQARELAKKIGSRSDYVKRVLPAYQIYLKVQDNNFFKIPKLDDTTLHFNYFADSLRHENIKNFINVNLNSENPNEKLELSKLEILTKLFFEKNNQNKSRVLGNSDNLTKLNRVLGNKDVTKLFLDGMPLHDAYSLVEVDSETFHGELEKALQNLKNANSYIHRIDDHLDSDIDTLKEVVDICKIIKNSIVSKKDEWSL